MSQYNSLIYNDGSSYAWTPEMGEEGIIIRMSKSTLTSSKWCPQQLWLSKNYAVPEESKPWLTIGDDVHHTLEEFYHRAEPDLLVDMKKAALKGEDRVVLETFQKWLPSKEEVIGMRRPSGKDEPFYEMDYQHNIDWLMRNELLRLSHSEVDDFLPVANEVKLSPRTTFNVDGVDVPVQLTGIIDRVFSDGQGGLALMELKTGKWRDNKLSEMRMEMAYYKMLIELSTNEELEAVGLNDQIVTHWGWRYSAVDRLDYEPVKRVSERAMHNSLSKLLKMYLTENFPITTADFKCSYCDYMDLCPKFKSD